MRIAIIGSGLAAVAAAKVLISRGIKPVILDVGKKLEPSIQDKVKTIAANHPHQWHSDDLNFMSRNPTVHDKNAELQKLAFGSDYFYGRSEKHAALSYEDVIPPFSYAKGGFSVGWGASALPADDCDLDAWPIKTRELKPYYRQVLADLPYSATDDGLSDHFPLYKNDAQPIKLTEGNEAVLRDLTRSNLSESGQVVFGQSRLMVNASNNIDDNGCRYCGCCMNGCAYGCIYKSDQDIDKMITSNSIEYVTGVLVQTLQEQGDSVNISLIDNNGSQQTLSFDRVFLAAGATNSTRILLHSKKIYNKVLTLKSTLSFVVPMFRIKRAEIDWPNVNTQPGLLLEFKTKSLSDHWIHTQVSTPNEMVLEKLGIDLHSKGLIQSAKKKFAEHLMIAHCNMHSDHANGYRLELKKGTDGIQDVLHSQLSEQNDTDHATKKAVWKLLTIGKKIGCYPAIPFVQKSTKGYHVGGTLPMMQNPEKETDTNLLGNPKGWTRIHVIDSSVFPTLPGTTIGLLAMANATRIATEVELK